ncbi:hypothetical protein PRK78_005762 [Emydomyces testavorans]|uniref:Uncharacterized protein n=1 Tax=Emydomyces testavorans TaxID=2070801 RepID=A0AAF0DMB8_9EURO|nr:hypothetical protein PRK78_005762 [Emydomyces testavorans]
MAVLQITEISTWNPCRQQCGYRILNHQSASGIADGLNIMMAVSKSAPVSSWTDLRHFHQAAVGSSGLNWPRSSGIERAFAFARTHHPRQPGGEEAQGEKENEGEDEEEALKLSKRGLVLIVLNSAAKFDVSGSAIYMPPDGWIYKTAMCILSLYASGLTPILLPT